MLRDAPAHPSDLADALGVSRQILSNHLACLRDCGLVVAQSRGPAHPLRAGRPASRARARRPHGLVVAVDPECCPAEETKPAADAGPARPRRATLPRRIRLLVAATITYNVVEAVVALAAGTRASSTALVGFGLDSVVEVSSAAAVAWQFSAPDPEAREKAALRIIAVSFFALAAYVTVDAVRSLPGSARPGRRRRHRARRGLPGRSCRCCLGAAPHRPGAGLASAVADSKQTLLCTYLSAVLLVGLVLNSLLGWSWADPIAALVIAAVALKKAATLGAGTCAADERSRCASSRARLICHLRRARIWLAQLGTATPHRIDGLPRHQRTAGFGNGSPASASSSRWRPRSSRRFCSWSGWCRR